MNARRISSRASPTPSANLERLLRAARCRCASLHSVEALQRIVASTRLREIAPLAPRLTVRLKAFPTVGYPADKTGMAAICV